ncbi:protein hunchback [Hylaeus anthracinus]|uniref:protein hunchback n=1 Tax=Hylaeus anthracinus TaxID=313031 RepID=UPI0023B92AB6|nr:protein hunchback [Hylaeus anthracinus]
MRGNWDTAEALVHMPSQQRQDQEQTIVEEQRHSIHSLTTPAWNIADRIVKSEPSEDKNNDSGVSPDHYTSNSASPRSRRSSTTANCSLSPGSATSQESGAMQCSTYDYGSQQLFKNCGGSPLEFSMDVHHAEQAMNVVSSTVKPSNEDADISQDVLQCPICAFTALNRLTFTEHLATHCTMQSQPSDFAKTVLGQLTPSGSIQDESRSSPTQGERSEHESEEADEPGLRVPRVNSQGKVKTFRCKQCNFVAITKLEFWEHSRGHIKAEKLLTCPKCPFVTEYKHHLEYHLRNHFGSKPFKCDKCSYSCVNKSMLNSHLKSHSNVYQYRCANCSYATKYCHSLKLHLRKYSHQPAMVLNADGSPNPLPIIDVYGTRRGPKQKSYAKSQEDSAPNSTVVTTTTNAVQAPLSSPQIAAQPQISPVSHLLPSPLNGINIVPQSPSIMSFPYGQLFADFPLATSHFSTSDVAAFKASVLMDYAKTIDGEMLQDLAARRFSASNGSPEEVPKPIPSTLSLHDQCSDEAPIPLDLSKPDPVNLAQRTATNSPKTTGTSRRKGRAVKLERRVIEEDTDDELQQYQKEPVNLEVPVASRSASLEPKDNNESGLTVGAEFTCQYCEIAFGNVVMYTVHMGYHGYNDPYTCNMCGHQCTDKVSFFLHIARSKHS